MLYQLSYVGDPVSQPAGLTGRLQARPSGRKKTERPSEGILEMRMEKAFRFPKKRNFYTILRDLSTP